MATMEEDEVQEDEIVEVLINFPPEVQHAIEQVWLTFKVYEFQYSGSCSLWKIIF